MIIEKMFLFSTKILEIFFSLFPDIPNIPTELQNKIFNFLDMIFSNSENILGLFIRIDTIKIVVPVLILIINFDKIYYLLLWVLKKIPILGIE